jgi:hypothetical protein
VVGFRLCISYVVTLSSTLMNDSVHAAFFFKKRQHCEKLCTTSVRKYFHTYLHIDRAVGNA